MSGMDHATMKHQGHDMGAMDHAKSKREGHDMGGMKHESHSGKPLALGQQVGIIMGTFALLVLVLVIVGQFVPIRFS